MVPLLLACGRCPEVVPVSGGADAVSLAEVERAVGDFARWTGGQRACLEEVEVQAGFAEGEQVSLDRRTLQINAGARGLQPVYNATLHGLCHALDDEEGWSEELDLSEYPVPGTHEVHAASFGEDAERFALLCSSGPYASPVVAGACDRELAAYGLDVHEAVWTEPPAPVLGGQPYDTVSLGYEGSGVRLGESLLLVRSEDDDPITELRDPDSGEVLWVVDDTWIPLAGGDQVIGFAVGEEDLAIEVLSEDGERTVLPEAPFELLNAGLVLDGLAYRIDEGTIVRYELEEGRAVDRIAPVLEPFRALGEAEGGVLAVEPGWVRLWDGESFVRSWEVPRDLVGSVVGVEDLLLVTLSGPYSGALVEDEGIVLLDPPCADSFPVPRAVDGQLYQERPGGWVRMEL